MLPLQSGDPQILGRYVLIARLGSGGMGHVFLGRTRGGRTVAVKAVKPELASNPDFRRRFRREVEAARSVSGRHTAPVVDADPDAPVPWLATAFVSGPTLREVVDDGWRLPEASLAVLAGGLARALTEIHAAGIVHRDLKPSNVMLAVDGPRVIDFGISRVLGAASDLTRTDLGVIVGSTTFMSPEQAQGHELTPATDVFSLGGVLAFAATGRSPFSGGGDAAVLYRIVHAEPNLAGLPAGLSALVADCLAKDPGERPTPAQIIERTARAVEDGAWLPAALTASIAQSAAEILDYEGIAVFPEPDQDTPPPSSAASAEGGGAEDEGGEAGEADSDADMPPTTVLPFVPPRTPAEGGAPRLPATRVLPGMAAGVAGAAAAGAAAGAGANPGPAGFATPGGGAAGAGGATFGGPELPHTRVMPTIPPGSSGGGWPDAGPPAQERVSVGRPPEPPRRSTGAGILVGITIVAIVAALTAALVLALRNHKNGTPGPAAGTATQGAVSTVSVTSAPSPTPTSSSSPSATPTPSASSSSSSSPSATTASSSSAEPTTTSSPTATSEPSPSATATKATQSAPSSAAGTVATGATVASNAGTP